jgi:hypothetical protein
VEQGEDLSEEKENKKKKKTKKKTKEEEAAGAGGRHIAAGAPRWRLQAERAQAQVETLHRLAQKDSLSPSPLPD